MLRLKPISLRDANEYVRQRAEAESSMSGNKETDRPLNTLIDKEVRDEKAVNIAIRRLYEGQYVITHKSVEEQEREERAVKALQAVGLGERLYHKSNQMSGGQMQRVAIARALVNDPAVILADEATGNLDTRTSFEILILFQKLHAAGRTIIFVTHNPDIANYSSRNIMLRDGHVISDEYNTNILSAEEGLAALPASSDE